MRLIRGFTLGFVALLLAAAAPAAAQQDNVQFDPLVASCALKGVFDLVDGYDPPLRDTSITPHESGPYIGEGTGDCVVGQVGDQRVTPVIWESQGTRRTGGCAFMGLRGWLGLKIPSKPWTYFDIALTEIAGSASVTVMSEGNTGAGAGALIPRGVAGNPQDPPYGDCVRTEVTEYDAALSISVHSPEPY